MNLRGARGFVSVPVAMRRAAWRLLRRGLPSLLTVPPSGALSSVNSCAGSSNRKGHAVSLMGRQARMFGRDATEFIYPHLPPSPLPTPLVCPRQIQAVPNPAEFCPKRLPSFDPPGAQHRTAMRHQFLMFWVGGGSTLFSARAENLTTTTTRNARGTLSFE